MRKVRPTAVPLDPDSAYFVAAETPEALIAGLKSMLYDQPNDGLARHCLSIDVVDRGNGESQLLIAKLVPIGTPGPRDAV